MAEILERLAAGGGIPVLIRDVTLFTKLKADNKPDGSGRKCKINFQELQTVHADILYDSLSSTDTFNRAVIDINPQVVSHYPPAVCYSMAAICIISTIY
jgi:hypothetical protein